MLKKIIRNILEVFKNKGLFCKILLAYNLILFLWFIIRLLNLAKPFSWLGIALLEIPLTLIIQTVFLFFMPLLVGLVVVLGMLIIFKKGFFRLLVFKRIIIIVCNLAIILGFSFLVNYFHNKVLSNNLKTYLMQNEKNINNALEAINRKDDGHYMSEEAFLALNSVQLINEKKSCVLNNCVEIKYSKFGNPEEYNIRIKYKDDYAPFPFMGCDFNMFAERSDTVNVQMNIIDSVGEFDIYKRSTGCM